MKPNIRITAARLAALLVLAALLGVGVKAAVAEENTLITNIGGWADIGTDPTISTTISPEKGGWQWYHIYTHYSPLICLDSNANVIPWMAESYEVSDDYKIITFHLRKGIKFADGTPLNASILKFNYDRIITYGWADKLGIQNPGKFYDYSEAQDEYTFRIHFTQGWLDMPFNLAGPHFYGRFISPLDVDPAWDIKGILKQEKMYNGLGPYYVDENESKSKDTIVLRKRNSWRNDLDFHKPKLEKIVLKYIADPQVAVMALEKGEIDYINRYWNPTMDNLPELKKNPTLFVKTRPNTVTYYIKTAYWKEPFNGTDGILLRKAINYALDRKEMVNGTFFGYAIPATDTMFLSPLLPNVPECCHRGYDYNMEKAKQLLSEGGWKDADGDGILDKNGNSLKDIALVITSSTDLIWQEDLALIVQSQLKKIGIDVKIKTLEWAAYSETANSGDYDLSFAYNQPRGTTAGGQLVQFSRKPGINDYANSNGTLEEMANGARIAEGEEERDRLICQASDILFEEAGIIPMVHPMEWTIMNSKVKGFEFGVSEMNDNIEECWIEE